VARERGGDRAGADVMSDVMAAHVHAAPDASVWALTLMWFAMMATMMAPTAWPWAHAYYRLAAADRRGALGATWQFASGHLLAWLGYAMAAALLQRALHVTALLEPSGDAVVPAAGGVIFLVAGMYQFAPLKRRCLTHCRTPLGYFLTRWIDGPMGAMRMGFHHGLYCVGCCWALMMIGFAVGLMNVWWMAVLAAAAFAEQSTRHGELLRRVLGAAFLLSAAVHLAQ
jgi:predicted metal-binding membrane protein